MIWPKYSHRGVPSRFFVVLVKRTTVASNEPSICVAGAIAISTSLCIYMTDISELNVRFTNFSAVQHA